MEAINKMEALGEEALNLAEANLHLWKLKAVDKTANLASNGVWSICFFILMTLFVLMVSVGLAIWTGEKLGKLYYGFFIVSLFYLLLALIVWAFRKPMIKTPIVNHIIKSFLHA
jgi:hypothetical protein